MKTLVYAFTLSVLFAGAAPSAVSLKLGDETLSEPSSDNQVRAAIEAFNRGRFFEAVRIAKPLAEGGNSEALLIMGLAYESGQGTDLDRALAIENFRKAREAGSQEAAYRLARLLIDAGGEEGQKEAQSILELLAKDDKGVASRMLGEGSLRGWFGGEGDFEKTRFWWAKSAEKGDVAAILGLARLLDGNFGFPEKRDPAAALEQFLKAADLGNGSAMLAAGSRLLNGDEKIRNEKLGREWLVKAIAKGELDAYFALGDFEEMIGKDDKAAFVHYSKGAEAGQSGCMLKLASFHIEGRGGQEKDAGKALEWFKKAGEAGNALGHVQAAAMLLKGEGLQVIEGYAHLVAAGEAGLADIQNEVGLLYLSGRLGVRDGTAAAGWFSRAAAGGFAQAAFNLATLYEQGIGVPKSAVQAVRLYTQATNAGHAQATSALGRFHAGGIAIKQDLPKSWALFSLALKRGDDKARAPLGELTSQLTEEQVAEGRRILAGFESDSEKTDASKPDGE